MKDFTVLAIAPHYGANAPRHLVDAMELCGARVIRVGPKYGEHLGMTWADSEMPRVDLEIFKNSNWYIDGFVDAATRRETAPDMVFLSEESYNNLIVNTEKVPSVFYSCDGWPENYARAEMVKATKNYSNHIGIRVRPIDTLPEPWEFLPGGCAPWIHKYLGLERMTDFCLFGSEYGKRKEICEALSLLFSVEHGQVKTPGFVSYNNRSLCTLHNPQPGEVKWRFFEAASMGCINISWGCQLFERLGYKAWTHYFPINVLEDCDDPWPNIEQMEWAVNDIKNNHVFFRRMATIARQHTIENHTYYHRAKRIFEDLGFGEMAEKAQEKIDGAWSEHLGE